jgi:signal transduction histidine kinase
MKKDDIIKLNSLLDERNIKLMEREIELAEREEEIMAQKEELTAAIDEITIVNKQLIEKNKELDQILYRSSHDLIGPISSIDGILQLIQAEEVPENLQVYLGHIAHKNSQMKEVMQILNTLARITQNEWISENINVFEVVNSCIKDLLYILNASFIHFQLIIDKTLNINLDRMIFATLVKSLLSNSIIFRSNSCNSGYVKITVSLRSENSKRLHIEVEDDGEGISDDIADKIFEMFYRGSSKSTGLGMGLYTLKKISQRLNGEIFWTSVPNKTVFYVELILV